MLHSFKRGKSVIIKKRSLQMNYLSHSALIKRIDPLNPKFQQIHNNFMRAKSGVWGEESIDYYLSNYHHPYPHLILQDVHLFSNSYFQIDNLFITQFFILVIEVKNIKGDIELTQKPFDLIRTNELGEQMSLDSPEEQLEKNMIWLNDWLGNKGWTIPVKGIIVFTNMDSKIKVNETTYSVVKGKHLPTWIRKMEHTNEYLTVDQMNELAEEINTNHKNYKHKSILERYQLTKDEIITGVQCPECFEFGMKKHRRHWSCSNNHRSVDAHIKTLDDYFYIFGMSITNKECRRFLQIENVHVSKRLLTSMDLHISGKTKRREYVKTNRGN